MTKDMMTRREMLTTTGAALAGLSTPGLAATAAQGLPMLKNMGGEGPGFANRSRAGGFDILEHCHTLGLGVVRLSVPQGADAIRAVRRKLDAVRHALYCQRCAATLGCGRDRLRRLGCRGA